MREYYNFLDVDVDRYEIDGEPRVLMVSAREINPEGIAAAAQTWQNVHLAYTHGFGAVASQVNTATPEGGPLLTLQNMPPGRRAGTDPAADLLRRESRRFRRRQRERRARLRGFHRRACPTPGRVGSRSADIFRRALFAWNFRDVNLLLSGQVTARAG